jgi:3-phosphoshikimate 1-carboxyvinyltransferase
MRRVSAPLQQMGAQIETAEGGFPPITINISNSLHAIEYKPEVASAQLKSAVLLAGLYAKGETVVREPAPTRDYTERMLSAFGWPIRFEPGFAALSGGHRLRATDVAVPSDFSSAAFFLAAASLVPGSDLVLPGVGMNPRRTGLLEALRLMGADIEVLAPREQGGEPVADLRVRHAPLHGIDLPQALVPDMIDEFPVLFVAAALARGRSRFRGIGELRVKESDRLGVMATALRDLGADVEEGADYAEIQGGQLAGGQVDSHGDHRIAMSLAVAAQLARGPIRIGDCANVDTSFPGFVELARSCGLGLELA